MGRGRTAILASLVACISAWAQGDAKDDRAAKVLDSLPAIDAASNRALAFEAVKDGRVVGWVSLSMEAKPDASGGEWLLSWQVVLSLADVGAALAARHTAEVTARFAPKKLRLEQMQKGRSGTTGEVDTLDVVGEEYVLARERTGAKREERKVARPRFDVVTGMAFLAQLLPRDRIDGLVLKEVEAQSEQPREKRFIVDKQAGGRTVLTVGEVGTDKEIQFAFGPEGKLEAWGDPPFLFRACTAERLAELQKQFPEPK